MKKASIQGEGENSMDGWNLWMGVASEAAMSRKAGVIGQWRS